MVVRGEGGHSLYPPWTVRGSLSDGTRRKLAPQYSRKKAHNPMHTYAGTATAQYLCMWAGHTVMYTQNTAVKWEFLVCESLVWSVRLWSARLWSVRLWSVSLV